jgi:hypothetical protein
MKKFKNIIGLAVVTTALALLTLSADAQTVQSTGLTGGKTSIIAAGTNTTSADFTFAEPRSRAVSVQVQFQPFPTATNAQGTVAVVLEANVFGTNWFTWGKFPCTIRTNAITANEWCNGLTNFDSYGLSTWRGRFENGIGVTLTNVTVNIGQKSGL